MMGVDAEIIALEAERRNAMVAGDISCLEQLIHDGALYVHTSGLRETKAEYLHLLRTGAYRYRSVSQPELEIQSFGDVAVVTGRTVLEAVLPDGGIKVVDGRSIVVWVREPEERWRMIHYQGTRF